VSNLKIAVLSGKGGTGKTTVATNIAAISGGVYADCDVEEPNGFIFLRPENVSSRKVMVDVPVIDDDKCVLCGKCASACKFNALGISKTGVMLFEKLCHSCGACSLACPVGAITETKRELGNVETGIFRKSACISGILNVGEPIAVPIIKSVKADLNKVIGDEDIVIYDCPPGTACTAVASVKDADFALLVTEPTKFGLHDLDMAVQLLRGMKKPFAIIVNRSQSEEDMIFDYAAENGIDIIGRIPFDRDIAVLYSQGKLISDDSKYREAFKDIYKRTTDLCREVVR
jgi:MinD superfamily P-loop ATPase